ncbi:MFS transporter [Mariniluteicoccus endophyticus]
MGERLGRALPEEGRAALRGGVVGNFVDQLHIFLPLLALAPALKTVAGGHATAMTGALVVMAMLLGRPVGGIVFGRFADHLGRTRTTTMAIAGTAACTLGIAAVPTHEVIGPAAIVIVLLLRFLGGIFIAGEYSAAIPLAMEWSRPRRRGLFSGLIMAMAPWAQATIAFASAALLNGLGPTAYAAWGWRLCFVAGGCASLAMLVYYRTHVADAPLPLAAPKGDRPRLVDLLAGPYASAFWQMFGLMTGLWFLTNMTVMVLTARLGSDAGLSPATVSTVIGAAAIGQAVVMSLTGHLSTATGRRRFFVGWGLLAAVAGPVLWWLATARILPVWLVAAAAIGTQVVTVTAYGPIGAYLSERFPAAIRSTGYGTAYSLSIVVPALYPYYLPALEAVAGRTGAVLALIVLGGLLVAACGAMGPALRPAELDHDVETIAEAVGRA